MCVGVCDTIITTGGMSFRYEVQVSHECAVHALNNLRAATWMSCAQLDTIWGDGRADTIVVRGVPMSAIRPQVAEGANIGYTLDRDIDLKYHWSSAEFCSAWRDTISVLVARGRAQVGVHAAKSDWSKRIRDFQFMDYDDHATHH